MSLQTLLALLLAMTLLAALPSASVLAVTARAASAGFCQGAWVAAGIVTGDVVFILLAVTGLALLASLLGPAFIVINGLAAAYLLWLGWQLWQRRRAPAELTARRNSRRASFTSGLLITLGDQKAALFYLGFLPAFVELTALSVVDVGLIVLATVVSVGGVKLAYAAVAARLVSGHASPWSGEATVRRIHTAAALLLWSAALWLLWRWISA